MVRLIGMFLVLTGCTGAAGQMDPAETPVDTSAIVLTDSEPRTTVRLPWVDGAERLILRLRRISNAQAAGFIVRASLIGPGSAERLPIGSISPFPTSQPGLFRLRLPPEARRVERDSAWVRLVVEILPATKGGPLPERIEIDSLGFARDPPAEDE